MNADKIRLVTLTVLKKFLVNPDELQKVEEGESLLESSVFDSLSTINLLVQLENAFGVRLDSSDVEGIFTTLDTLVEHIESRLTMQDGA